MEAQMVVTPQGIILIIFGFFICFSGYSIFKSMLPLWGFILGGLVALNFAPGILGNEDPTLLFQIISFAVGGVIGALISSPLYFVSVFLTGAAMGGLLGIVFGAYLEISGGAPSVKALSSLAGMHFPPDVTSNFQLILLIVFGIITGGLAIAFQKFMITASTAFIGSAAIVAGGNGAAIEILRNDANRAVWILLAWLIVAMIGLFVQYRLRDET
jgi:hypothetical protein